MSVRQDLGKVSIVPKGDWDSANTYERLDVVKYGGGSYIAKQDVSVGVEITNTAYWLKIVDKGDQGDQGIQGETGETGNGIASAVLNADYTLTLTFTDGTSYTTPSIRGEKGEKGDDGETPDLSNYVQKTDYATENVGGAVKVSSTYGLAMSDGTVYIHMPTTAALDNRNTQQTYYRSHALTLNRIDYALKKSITGNSETLTDAEKTAAKTWLGIVDGTPLTQAQVDAINELVAHALSEGFSIAYEQAYQDGGAYTEISRAGVLIHLNASDITVTMNTDGLSYKYWDGLQYITLSKSWMQLLS